MKPRALLFDAGETLWHNPEAWERTYFRALSERSLASDFTAFTAALEATQRAWAGKAASWEAGGVQTSTAVLVEFFRGLTQEVIERLGHRDVPDSLVAEVQGLLTRDRELYPEVPEALQALQAAGYRMAIVSNGWYQQEAADELGIAHYFDAIIGSMHVGMRKPQPEIFRLALTRLGVEPEDAVMVGDNYDVDVLGARAAGIRGIHLRRGAGEGVGLSLDCITDLRGLLTLRE